ncbi:HNH endonuclease signature motif containing protein [Kitasatospora sp. NPDC059088]|uniref:HNH endonuclease signature motif containing protein n=1 Tax=Kitasatospora sp. NPDC059088 TaxID=3346722 RepID=UPI00368345E6
MPANRPAIPRELDRQVRVEAGHCCAIQRCKWPIIEIAHIVPWSKVKRHDFDNLIALCPNCHTRYDRGEIDQTAVRQYKENLSLASPLALAIHPDHFDSLSDYQRFRIFVECWTDRLTEFNEGVESRVSKAELRARFTKVREASKQASRAWLRFALRSPRSVSRLADQVFHGVANWGSQVLRIPLREDFPRVMPLPPGALPAVWSELHVAIYDAIAQNELKPPGESADAWYKRPL